MLGWPTGLAAVRPNGLDLEQLNISCMHINEYVVVILARHQNEAARLVVVATKICKRRVRSPSQSFTFVKIITPRVICSVGRGDQIFRWTDDACDVLTP